MKLTKTTLYTAMAIASLSIAACSSSSTPDASQLTSTGRITGFGSVFVGGVEYETDQATIRKDGQPTVNGDNDLSVGMIVTVKGSTNGTQGVATSIEFNDELEGLVQDNTLASDGSGSLKVMGQTVTVDANTNFKSKDPAISLVEDIPPGAIVEVSGYPDGNGNILASFIELKAKDMASYGDDMEVKGIIKNLSETTTALTFDLGSQTIDATAIASVIDLGMPLADGLYVEVKSKTGFDASTGFLIASKIELENGGDYGIDGEHGEEMEVEGLITAIDTDKGSIEVNGKTILLPANTDLSQFIVGELIKIEFSIDADGNAVMNKIEKEDAHDDDEDFSIKAYIDSIDPDNATITVDGKVIKVDKFNAIMIDKSDDPEKYFSIDTLAVGDFVELEVYIDADGNYIAIKVERETPES